MKTNYEKIINEETLSTILDKYPVAYDFFENLRISDINKETTLKKALEEIDEEILIDFGIEQDEVVTQFIIFLSNFSNYGSSLSNISKLTIIGGHNKGMEKENIELTISTGEVISIVGPTGSGKSRLLEDIECLAQGDTPTGRTILLNNSLISDDVRFELDGKLVAQLSQNMNFVMDLSVKEFLEMHARSRLRRDTDEIVEKCFHQANELAGEKFDLSTKITQLSGGQSRALMIADTAFMSESPIVLIDEIENAGINRKDAIKLLARRDKIILISTHDPMLALNADKRIVINNGGIAKVIETTNEEKENLVSIETLDSLLQEIREDLRYGKNIRADFEINNLYEER